jgi:hypothetical protein
MIFLYYKQSKATSKAGMAEGARCKCKLARSTDSRQYVRTYASRSGRPQHVQADLILATSCCGDDHSKQESKAIRGDNANAGDDYTLYEVENLQTGKHTQAKRRNQKDACKARERETIVRTCQWSSRRKKKGGNRRREARQGRAGLLSSRIRCRHP